jgi:hypothetical protein
VTLLLLPFPFYNGFPETHAVRIEEAKLNGSAWLGWMRESNRRFAFGKTEKSAKDGKRATCWRKTVISIKKLSFSISL